MLRCRYDQGPGQSVLSKGSFKPRPDHPIAVLPQGLAHQQITREIVGQRKRVTALTIPRKSPLKSALQI